MSTQPPPIASWLQKSLGSLFGSTTSSDASAFSTQFKGAVSPDALIYLNHQKISVDDLEAHIKNETILAHLVAEAEIDWKEISATDQGGVVAGYFIVIHTMKFRIRAAPAKTLGYKFFSAKVVKDASVQGGDDDNDWRITQLFLTEVGKPAPISLQSVGV